MRTFLLITLAVFLSKWGVSQCNPPAPTGEPHLFPSADLFPVIESGTPFSGTIYFENHEDSLAGPSGWLTIDSVVINTIEGLPIGIDYYILPDYSFLPSERGCIHLSGTTYDSPGVDSLRILALVYLQNAGAGPMDLSFLNDTAGLKRYYVQVVDTATGIRNYPAKPLTLFPNPASETITFSINILNTSYNIEVTDLSGKVIKSWSLVTEKLKTLDVSNLEQGIYFYRIFEDKKIIMQGKFVVM